MNEDNKDLGDEAKDALDDAAEATKQTFDDVNEESREVIKSDENKKMIAGILAIILGSLGIHKFILGYQKEGIIMLAISIIVGFFTCGIGFSIMGIIGLIEGIIYLTKSDEEFYNTYQIGKKPWF
jgi:TM2 domain-containing membrane protein YozV